MTDKCAAAEDKALALRIAHTQAREATRDEHIAWLRACPAHSRRQSQEEGTRIPRRHQLPTSANPGPPFTKVMTKQKILRIGKLFS